MIVTKETLEEMTMEQLEALAFRTLEQVENGQFLLRTIKEIRDRKKLEEKTDA